MMTIAELCKADFNVQLKTEAIVSVELCCKIDATFKRLKRYGYTTDYLTFSHLLDKADSDSVLQHSPELSLFTSRPSSSSHG